MAFFIQTEIMPIDDTKFCNCSKCMMNSYNTLMIKINSIKILIFKVNIEDNLRWPDISLLVLQITVLLFHKSFVNIKKKKKYNNKK